MNERTIDELVDLVRRRLNDECIEVKGLDAGRLAALMGLDERDALREIVSRIASGDYRHADYSEEGMASCFSTSCSFCGCLSLESEDDHEPDCIVLKARALLEAK